MLSTVNFLVSLLPDFEKPLQTTLPASEGKSVCIVGDGMYGLAVASLMSARCKRLDIVKLKDFDAHDEPLFANIEGDVSGEHRASLKKLRAAVIDRRENLFDADYVILTGGVNAFDHYLSFVQTHLREGQNLVIVNAPIGAGLQFSHLMAQAGVKPRFNIAELGELFYGTRADGDTLVVGSIRARANLAGNTRNQLRKNIRIDALLPVELIPSSNVIERGLFEVERILRPTLLLFDILANAIDKNPARKFASRNLDDDTLNLTRKLEKEVAALGKAYKSVTPCFATIGEAARNRQHGDNDHLHNNKFDQAIETYYANLLSSITSSVNPLQRAYSIVEKDLGEHVMILSELAQVAGLATPALDSLIQFASGCAGINVAGKARRLSDLGLDGLALNDIVEFVNA